VGILKWRRELRWYCFPASSSSNFSTLFQWARRWAQGHGACRHRFFSRSLKISCTSARGTKGNPIRCRVEPSPLPVFRVGGLLSNRNHPSPYTFSKVEEAPFDDYSREVVLCCFYFGGFNIAHRRRGQCQCKVLGNIFQLGSKECGLPRSFLL